MTPTRLTIGIPTYNFARFLNETLASITPQLADGVEVLVLDGGSTDDTPAVMANWTARYPAVRYVRLPAPGGIDADISHTVAAAAGEYCWLFSADDLMDAGAVGTVLRLIEGEPDVVLLPHANCTFDMQVLRAVHPVLAGGARDFQWRDPVDRQAYLDSALSSEAFFSFLSGLVIRRRTWATERPTHGFFYGSCWGHAARLLTIARDEGLLVRWYPAPLLRRRGDNDSFLTAGVVARFALAIEGYQRIVGTIFGEDGPEFAALRRVLASEFRLTALLDAKLACHRAPAQEDRRRLDAMARGVHRGWRGRATLIAFRLAPSAMLGPAMRAKTRFGRWRAGLR